MRSLSLVGLVAIASCARGPAAAPPSTPPIGALDASRNAPLLKLTEGWNRIAGGDGTGCAHDSSFVFRVRPGAPEKVLIYLNGGGACWRAAECDPKGHPTYTMTADSANDASIRSGIFDVSNPANPVRGFTMVYVPYCTGDVHLGSRVTDYEVRKPSGAARRFAVRHEGSANIDAVLRWLYANVRAPRVVFVAGSSAGAIPSPVVAEKVARHYAQAYGQVRVVQLGDGAGGYRATSVPGVLAGWGATDYLRRDDAFRNVDSASLTFERLYTAAASAAPKVHYAQYNTAADETQLYFLSLLGVKAATLSPSLALDLAEIRRSGAWFRTYTAPGKVHTILRSPLLYSTTVDGVRFRDWLARLVEGGEVEDVGEARNKQKSY